jgi:hypothetical protein
MARSPRNQALPDVSEASLAAKKDTVYHLGMELPSYRGALGISLQSMTRWTTPPRKWNVFVIFDKIH